MASAVIRSLHLVAAILATTSLAAHAQTAPAKPWVDPGAVERAKTQSAETAPASPADAAKAAAAKPSATDSEKLKELIRAAEASSEAGKAKKSAHAPRRAVHTAHVHAAAHKKVVKAVPHPAYHPVAYQYLPNKKGGPVPSSSGPVSAAY